MFARMRFIVLLLTFLAGASSLAAIEPAASFRLWPDGAPGEKGSLPAETTTLEDGQRPGGRPILLTRHVSEPTVTLYRPAPELDTGTTVLVCPGGGYYVLAHDLEGTEVCAWLNSIGVTAALLKYRVPRRDGQDKHLAPLQDAQRAMGLLRQQATELGLDPDRLGVLGFSAGGHLAAALSTAPDARSYPAMGAADQIDSRPNFTVLVYPAYLTREEGKDVVSPELAISPATPPAFLVITQDDADRAPAALHYYLALHRERVPAELHVYPTGGHGYGLRRTDLPVTSWPDRVTDWLRASGWLERPQ